jgi:Fic family protein
MHRILTYDCWVTFRRDQPFNDLPFLPPPLELETKAVLKQALRASRALAELKAAGALIPNQSVLLSTLGLQEAKISSEIENIVTTNDELYRAFADQEPLMTSATKEVLSYAKALWHGFTALQAGRPISTRLIEEIGAIVKPQAGGIRRVPGTKIANSARETVYTPPEGESVIRDKLGNLEAFWYSTDDTGLDPLVKMAVMHYQFEAIHPFSDGNGRTGRILNILYLIEADLLEIPVLYLSRFIIEHKTAYYSGLRAVTEEGAWESWVLYMLEAVEQTALYTSRKILDIHTLMQETVDLVREQLPRLYKKELVELIFHQPYTKIRFLERAGLARNRQSASEALRALAELGVLEGVKVGREWYYLNPKFLAILSR